MGKKKSIEFFSVTEEDWGLAYAKSEKGVDVHPVLISIFANTILKIMKRTDIPFDDVRTEVLDHAYRTQFRRIRDTDKVREEMEAISEALGKMFNNRQNMRRPNFTPTRRISKKRDRRPRVVTELSGQRAVKF